MHQQQKFRELYRQLAALMREPESATLDILKDIYLSIEQNYATALNDFYQNAHTAQLEDLDITSVINFNRELFSSNKAILMAVKDMVLDEVQAEKLGEIMGYRS